MNPIDQLKSVLCGPEGKCCIAGSDEDRSIVDRALQALAEPAVEPVVWYDGRKFYATPSAAHMDCADIKALRPLYEAPQAQQPPRIGSGVTVEQTLEQWEHDFRNPMTPEQVEQHIGYRLPEHSMKLLMQLIAPPPVDALAVVVGCFEAAESEGLSVALAETTDERLKDLVERRLMYALLAAKGEYHGG